MILKKSSCFARPWGASPFRASVAVVVATLLAAASVRGAFHLWNIREVYTDASGTRQFIEFFTTSANQQFVSGQQVRVSDGVTTRTFTIPSNLPASSANRAFLLGTAGIQPAGAPVPDYTIPDNFLFPNGGTITFFGANSGPYTALPTDGSLSRTWTGGNAVNSPQNYAGQTGSINIPPNSPPAVSITNPPASSLFAAPATVAVGVSASDSDGNVVNVQLLTNGLAAATNTVAPFGFTLSGLAAGYYTLRARAQDNGALVTTSAPVTIRVANRPGLVAAPGVTGPIRFEFNTATGITYVIERAGALTNFSSVATNPGSGGVLQFNETNSAASQRTYRVRLQ